MFEIDKQKFGAFVAELRKEKALTQRELAQQLFISDKAVSKWETGVSIPDTVLLVPLAELLGVTVTELLMCERIEHTNVMDTGKIESIVKTAIRYSDEGQVRAYQTKSRWHIAYILSLIAGIAGCVGVFIKYVNGYIFDSTLTYVILGAVLGAYFCFFVRLRLPKFYDENRMCAVFDGVFHIRLTGATFNNRNWRYVVEVGRIWSCAVMMLTPSISLLIDRVFPKYWAGAISLAVLIAVLGGLFIPMYVVAKKYE